MSLTRAHLNQRATPESRRQAADAGAAGARILVTPRSFLDAGPDVRARLEDAVGSVLYNDRGRPLASEELQVELTDVDGLIAGVDELDASALAAAPRLRAIARYGTGVDTIDLEAARRCGIVVTNTPDANANAVAEHTLALMLALARRVALADREVRAGSWPKLGGIELAGRTVGVLGLGRVGSIVVKRCAALGCRVIAHDAAPDRERARSLGVELAEPEELLPHADVLTLHLPLTRDTRDLVDGALLAKLPPGALVVNTARGELVVEEDLAEALDSGELAGAALDALRQEPPPPDHPLVGRDDVIITPHLGAQTAEARRAMALASVEDLLAVLDGREPRYRVRATS